MRIVLINPPYRAVTSRYGLGAQTPLGLLLVGAALIRAGHAVSLLDGEARALSIEQIVTEAAALAPDVVMTGHAGSTPAHPVTMEMARALKARLPSAPIVYGGVYPTYHGMEILAIEPAIDVIVRGEGELTCAGLIEAMEAGEDLARTPGLFYRDNGRIRATPPAPLIANLDQHPAAWELIEDWDIYQCWGAGRSAVVQFSRGCPHQCSYCGQRDFWSKWRHRDPERIADEIAWLHREKGVNFVDLADENPTSSKRLWRAFLEAVIQRGARVKLFATIRAQDIVRDADILHLYRRAGIECVLMGMETTDPETLRKIRKGSTARDDMRAIRLLRQHGILSMAGHIAGFEEEGWRDYWRAFRQLLVYDPDLVNAMYVTPHRWTDFYRESGSRMLIEPDQSKWDYRHQLLATPRLRPWLVFTFVKLIELATHLRPRALLRALFYRDRGQRSAYRWCMRRAGLVWLMEAWEFMTRKRSGEQPQPQPQPLASRCGAPLVPEHPISKRL